MNAPPDGQLARRLRGGIWGPLLLLAFAATAALLVYGLYSYPSSARDYGDEIAFDNAMFGPGLKQPIAFSHRLHVTDKEIDCYYCHPFAQRSTNAGLPSVMKCLGCHDRIIPEHQEIRKLRAFRDAGIGVPWTRVYYNPDHVYFPHFRHTNAGVECAECHSDVGRVDRLHKVTFYMGFCLDCHRKREAPLDCIACHQ